MLNIAFKIAGSLSDYRRILSSILSESKEVKKQIKELSGQELFEWLILNPFIYCIDGNRSTALIIIDGMDEVDFSVAKFLYDRASLFPDWVKFLFTSRYDATVAVNYSSSEIIMLDIYSENNNRDIKGYIAYKLHKEMDSPEVCVLSDKSEGSFMYAKIVCDAVINKSISISVDGISELPVGLNSLYNDYFMRLFPTKSSYVNIRSFLELICVDDEITEEIVYSALKIDKYDLWEIRTKLKGLVVVEEKKKYGKISKVFHFVHKSIADWITVQELSGQFFIDVINGYNRLLDTQEDIKAIWYIKAQRYDEYRDLLLHSFDREKMENDKFYFEDYTYYYKYSYLWESADMFPENYDITELKNKLKEIIRFPLSKMCSSFSHRSFQILSLLFFNMMKTKRYVDLFFEYMQLIRYSFYFQSGASDFDGETRDGWDKFWLTCNVARCIKFLDKKHILVPEAVRCESERMKLTFHFYYGKPYDYFPVNANGLWNYNIFSKNALYKDICRYEPDNDVMAELKKEYNTFSLKHYLIYDSDEDDIFIRECSEQSADVIGACICAEDLLLNHSDELFLSKVNKDQRIIYIKSVCEKYKTIQNK